MGKESGNARAGPKVVFAAPLDRSIPRFRPGSGSRRARRRSPTDSSGSVSPCPRSSPGSRTDCRSARESRTAPPPPSATAKSSGDPSCRPDGRYRLRAEAYIDSGDADTSKNTFDALHEKKKEMEQAVGDSLDWDRLDHRRASRISLYFPDEIRITDEERWTDARTWLVQAMGKMRNAFNPVLEELPD